MQYLRMIFSAIQGVASLSSKDEMWSDIKKRQANTAKRYVASQRHTI